MKLETFRSGMILKQKQNIISNRCERKRRFHFFSKLTLWRFYLVNYSSYVQLSLRNLQGTQWVCWFVLVTFCKIETCYVYFISFFEKNCAKLFVEVITSRRKNSRNFIFFKIYFEVIRCVPPPHIKNVKYRNACVCKLSTDGATGESTTCLLKFNLLQMSSKNNRR